MTSDDAHAATRRQRRESGGSRDLSFANDPAPAAPPSTVALVDADGDSAAPDAATSDAPDDAEARTRTKPRARSRRTSTALVPQRTALGWLVESSVAPTSAAPIGLEPAAPSTLDVHPDLLARRPHRSPLRAGVLAPVMFVVLVVAAYAATTLLWPLYAVQPVVTAAALEPATAPLTTPAWPAEGSAAVGVSGIDGVPATTSDASSIASITKLVTSLMVLDQLPLAVGEQGPEYRFTSRDRSTYWSYRNRGESALDVPVGGTLSEYQMLQGVLIGSANNYADRLASSLWPTDQVFANAANTWLSTHGVTGVTIVDPSGIDRDNRADPAALLTLAAKALANPVIAEIVSTAAVELPGAGLVENTNSLLADPGVVGVKTGSLSQFFNLLAAKDIVVGSTPVRLYATVLGQPDVDTRNAAARALLAQLETELQPVPSLTAGTVAGVVTTAWGDRVDVVTSSDATVVLWNGGSGSLDIDFSFDDQRAADDTIGTLTVTGPLDASTVDLRLGADIDDPTPLWRLTHPLELFGLAG